MRQRGRSRAWEILLGLPRVGAEERALRALAAEILEMVGLSERRDELASELPYGEQRRLAQREALCRLLEVSPRRSLRPEDALVPLGNIEINLQDPPLGPHQLDGERYRYLDGLAHIALRRP